MSLVRDHLYDLEEVEHCWIPLADGVRLSARLWLPVVPEGVTVPAILEYIPYRKRDLVRRRDERNHPFFARHGYASVRVDMRGSGDSEGVMTDMYSAAELDDALQVIAWIARQGWCDGKVGMMGTSWGGTSSLQAAARRPPELRAIIAVCATDNRFDDDIHHMGGCLLTDTVEWGATLPAILALPPDPDTVGPDWRAIWLERLEAAAFPLEAWIRHETRDAYWQWGSVDETPDAIDCPLLAIGGWVDRYSNTVMNLLRRSGDRAWGIVGPWGHHYPDQASPGPGIGFQQEALRWWDRWLKGVENGVDREPRLRVWMQDYQPPSKTIQQRAGRWIGEDRWPSATISEKRFFLDHGRLGETACDPERTAVLEPSLKVGVASGDTGYFGRHCGLAEDQGVDDANALTFESAPLSEPLEILGAPLLTLALSADRPLATLVARLNDVAPDGTSARIVFAVRNLGLEEGGRNPRPLDRNQVCRAEIAFPNTAYRVARGHRLRLALSSSYWPMVWPGPTDATLRLHLDEAALALPCRLASGREAEVSLAHPPLHAGSHAAPRLLRHREDDAESKRRVTRWHLPMERQGFGALSLALSVESRAVQEIDLTDPNSACAAFEQRFLLERGDWTAEVRSEARLRSTAGTFNPTGRLQVWEDGALLFERRWAPVVPRRFS